MEAREFNAAQLAAGKLTVRHTTQLVRFWQRHHRINPDGKAGPQTLDSLDHDWEEMDTPGLAIAHAEPPDQAIVEVRNGQVVWPHFDGTLKAIPTTRQQILETFGDPGTPGKPNKSWQKSAITPIREFPGIPSKLWIDCHKLIEPYLREALARAQHASSYRITRLGCFNLRHVRDDDRRPLSLHSWGIAVDVNPDQNQAVVYERGRAPVPWGEEWKKRWPEGVDETFVEAMESVGFTWGGVWGRRGENIKDRAKRVAFVDPMHFELRDNLG